MGLVDDLIGTVLAPLDPLGLLGGVTGTGGGGLAAPLNLVTGLAGTVTALPGQIVGEAIGAVSGIAGIPGQILGGGAAAAGAGTVDMTGFGGGNGSVATRTIVETMDLRTGQIVRRKIMEGSPHIMNKDISAAKKVFRSVRKLDARLPKKTRARSKTKELADAAVDKAIRATQTECPQITVKP